MVEWSGQVAGHAGNCTLWLVSKLCVSSKNSCFIPETADRILGAHNIGGDCILFLFASMPVVYRCLVLASTPAFISPLMHNLLYIPSVKVYCSACMRREEVILKVLLRENYMVTLRPSSDVVCSQRWTKLLDLTLYLFSLVSERYYRMPLIMRHAHVLPLLTWNVPLRNF